MAQPARTFPFSLEGAAADTRLPTGPVTLIDLTSRSRFGLKGPGTVEWLTARGLVLPEPNRIGQHGAIRILRLGGRDILLTAESDPIALADLLDAWNATTGPRGYSSWREEGWAWMRLSGPRVDEAMTALCAIDLRPGHFADDEITQTRVAHVEAVVTRAQEGFDVFFDISLSAFVARAIAEATRDFAGQAIGEH